MPGSKRWFLVAAISVATLITTASPAAAQQTTLQQQFERLSERVLVSATDEEQEGLDRFLTCLSERVAAAPATSSPGALEGLAGECATALGAALPGGIGDRTPGGFSVGLGRGGSTPGYACAWRGGDPRVAQNSNSRMLDQAAKALKDADEARERAGKYDEKAKEAKDPKVKAIYEALKATALQGAELYEAIADGLIKIVTEPARQNLEATLTQVRTTPGAPDPCLAAADLAARIGECARASWRGGTCEMLAAQIYRCSDPSVTDPAPDAPTCAEQRAAAHADDGKVLDAAIAACEAVVKYGPDGVSPCVVGGVDGPRFDVYKAYPRECQGMDGGTSICVMIDVCANEKAMPAEDAELCLADVTLLDAGPDVAAILAAGLDRLGGPSWAPPSGGNGVLGPGPEHTVAPQQGL